MSGRGGRTSMPEPRVADSSLDPSEKEGRQVERLINKEPAPSRKHRPKRGPKHDNRRNRMHVEDADLDSKDPDMSLNYKGASALAVAARIVGTEATSYDRAAGEAMPNRTSAYHGVVGQGHPEGPTNTGWRSVDKRYLGKEHFDAIIASAKQFLDDDWLAHGWEDASVETPRRAALDLAIHTADGGNYQSKIDAETYDMLLNRLSGLGYDQFSETVLQTKRSASVMTEPADSILRVASELRHTHPREALEIVRSLRDAMSGGRTAADGLTDTDKDALSEDKMKDLKDMSKKLSESKSADDFAGGLKSMYDAVKKMAAGRIANSLPDLSVLEDMSDEEVALFLKGQKSRLQEVEKAAEHGDIDSFVKGLENALAELDKSIAQAKQASVRLPLSMVVRLAHSNPEARAAFMPYLVAAKKKQDKKKGKTSQKKDEKPAKKDEKDEKGKKPNPFAKKDEKPAKKDEKPAKKDEKGKKAPFGGKKSAPFGKKKASVVIASEDSDW